MGHNKVSMALEGMMMSYESGDESRRAGVPEDPQGSCPAVSCLSLQYGACSRKGSDSFALKGSNKYLFMETSRESIKAKLLRQITETLTLSVHLTTTIIKQKIIASIVSQFHHDVSH